MNNRPERRYLTRRTLAAAAIGAAPLPAAAQDVPLLPETVVTASRIEAPLDTVGSAITVITREDLDSRQTRLVSEVLREVPGVAVGRSGGIGGFTQLRIRGAEANHTLVLIDGIEANDPALGSEFDFAQLLAEDVERIEVLRGAQSALWGSDAIGGVVNIVTRKGSGPFKARAALEGGSRNTVQTSAAVSGGGAQYHYALALNRFTTTGSSAADERAGNPENDGFRNKSAQLKAGVTPVEAFSLDVIGRIEKAHGETDGFAAVTGAVDDNSVYDYVRRYGRAQATLRLFEGQWEHRLGAAVTDTDNTSVDGFATLFTNDGRKTKLDYQTTLLFDTQALAPASHALTLAAEREKDEIASASVFSTVNRDLVSDGYAGEYRVTLFEALALSGALRFDDNELFDDTVTWRLAGSWRIGDWGTRLKASHGTGVKNPTLFELFGTLPTFTGNPNLKPEKGRSYDVGIEQRLADGRAVVELTWFRNRIEDLIQGFGATATNVAGTSEIDGVELGLRWRPRDWLTLGASFTRQDPEDAAGAALLRRPKTLGSVNATASFAGGRGSVFLAARYNGPTEDVAFDAGFTPFRVRLDGYWLVDAAASFALTDEVELFGRIENLLNAHHQEVFGYGAPGFGAFAGLRVRI